MSELDAGSDFIPNQTRMRVECIRNFYHIRFKNLFSHVPVSFLPIYIGWTIDGWRVNLLLIALLWVYILTSIYLSYRFNSSSIPDERVPTWGRMLYPQYILLGLLYNVIFIHLAYYEVDNAMLYLFLITAGFSAASIGSFQHLKWLCALFVFFAIFPQVVYYMLQPNPGSALLAFVMLIFLVFMMNVGQGMYKEAMRTLSLTYELKEARDKAEYMALTDVLTGLHNRRAFNELGNAMMANAVRYKKPISAIMLDIDHFKQINDRYGHSAGDEAIKRIGDHMRSVARRTDILARVGGEEFCLLLPETASSDAGTLAERMRQQIEKDSFHYNENKVALTVSIGIAQHSTESNGIEHLMLKADKALYSAKEHGRNQIVVSS